MRREFFLGKDDDVFCSCRHCCDHCGKSIGSNQFASREALAHRCRMPAAYGRVHRRKAEEMTSSWRRVIIMTKSDECERSSKFVAYSRVYRRKGNQRKREGRGKGGGNWWRHHDEEWRKRSRRKYDCPHAVACTGIRRIKRKRQKRWHNHDEEWRKEQVEILSIRAIRGREARRLTSSWRECVYVIDDLLWRHHRALTLPAGDSTLKRI